MKIIPLTQGKVAIVDDADYDWLNQWRWYARKNRNTFYAVRVVYLPHGKRTTILMHRQILGLEFGDKRESDHKNHEGLNNRRCNLRVCNCAQNQQNRNARRSHSSAYKGVGWHKPRHNWRARIVNNGHRICLGYFVSEINAAHAYDKASKELFGEFASTNFV